MADPTARGRDTQDLRTGGPGGRSGRQLLPRCRAPVEYRAGLDRRSADIAGDRLETAMTVLPDPGGSRAVLIGASTYRHLEDLPAVGNNLSGFRDVLTAPALGGLPVDNCAVVAEPAEPVDLYRTLRQHAAAEDTLLVYFACDGRTGSRNELFVPARH